MSSNEQLKVNESIRALEVRVTDSDGTNIGVMPLQDAIKRARDKGLDLIEVSAKAKPPVARIDDYGKYAYILKKKNKEVKTRQHISETKSIQIKPGTGDNEKTFRGKKIEEWLSKNHRVKIDLFLWGRYKIQNEVFLKSKLESFLATIPVPYVIAEPIKKSPKGYSVIIQTQQKQNEKKQ